MGKWANLKRKLQSHDHSDVKIDTKVRIIDNQNFREPSKLELLPVELLNKISAYLSVKDRCLLRKSCKTLAGKLFFTKSWKTQGLVYQPVSARSEFEYHPDYGYLTQLNPDKLNIRSYAELLFFKNRLLKIPDHILLNLSVLVNWDVGEFTVKNLVIKNLDAKIGNRSSMVNGIRFSKVIFSSLTKLKLPYSRRMFQRLAEWHRSGHSHFPCLQHLEIEVTQEDCLAERIIIPMTDPDLEVVITGNIKKPCRCKNLTLFETFPYEEHFLIVKKLVLNNCFCIRCGAGLPEFYSILNVTELTMVCNNLPAKKSRKRNYNVRRWLRNSVGFGDFVIKKPVETLDWLFKMKDIFPVAP